MSGPGVGEQLIFGIAEESAYGTAATVSRFYPILDETLEAEVIPAELGQLLMGGVRNGEPASRDIKTGEAAKGTVKMEMPTTNAGLWLKHLLGTAAVSGSGADKTHTFSTGTVLGKSLSGQKAVRDAAATLLSPFTLNGMKVLKASFDLAVNGALIVTWTVDARQEETSTGAATASYVAAVPFVFSQAVLNLGGSPVANIKTIQWDYENPADTNRRFIGNGLYKSEPSDTGRPTVSGTFTAEFLNTTAYAWFKARTPVALSIAFTSTVNIPTTSTPYSLTFSVPQVILNGETPKAGGPGIITQNIPWVGRTNNAGDPLMSAVYVTSDTTP